MATTKFQRKFLERSGWISNQAKRGNELWRCPRTGAWKDMLKAVSSEQAWRQYIKKVGIGKK